jgi:putative ABC transport system permease protein
MIWYNIRFAFNRILKDKGFAAINIVGLVVGITSFLTLFLFVANEKSYDKHFSHYQDIYRVTSIPFGSEENPWARSLGLMYPALLDLPEVDMVTQFSHCPMGSIRIGEQKFQQKDIMSVDTNFIKMFSVECKVGDINEIVKPNVAFITEDFAKQHFGNDNPVGKTIEIDALQYLRDLGSFEIRGVVKNTHPKTHFNYEILLSQKGALEAHYASLPERKVHWVYTYVLLKSNTSPELVADKILNYFNASSLKNSVGPTEYHFNLNPLVDIHLKSNNRFELKESSNKINIGLFVAISFVILFVSILNSINLTIAKIIRQTKEIGIKKSIGANTTQLTSQILFEVFLQCLISILFSLFLLENLKPALKNFFEVDFNVYYNEPVVYFCILGVVGLSLGLTALFVGFNLFRKASTIDILSQKRKYSGSIALKFLLIVQVAIVISLLSGTFLVNKQISYIFNKPIGFDKENVLVVHLNDFSKDPAVFADELKRLSLVESVGFTNQHFGYPTQSFNLEGFGLEGNAELVFANYSYLETMKINLEKSWFQTSVDTISGLVVNTHLYNRLMEKHGTIEALQAFQNSENTNNIKVIGVTSNFNYNSAHESIGDFAFLLDESFWRARFTHIRLNPNASMSDIKSIEEIWKVHYPGQEFNYFFIDEKIDQQYKGEIILRRILLAFSIIGALISIIGVSALSLYISQQRTKEIGIRKVNGAKTWEVLVLLNMNFVRWVIVAFIIAIPISWFVLRMWLQNFAYRTELNWWIFVLAGALVLGNIMIIVSWQSWKVVRSNPIEALRYE